MSGKPITIGSDSVVIGDVAGSVGDRSVVIGATDQRGHVILTTPMAVGHRAVAGPGSIAIGAGAMAGVALADIKAIDPVAAMRGAHEALSPGHREFEAALLTALLAMQGDVAEIRDIVQTFWANAEIPKYKTMLGKLTENPMLTIGPMAKVLLMLTTSR
jgi:hypothetical protein